MESAHRCRLRARNVHGLGEGQCWCNSIRYHLIDAPVYICKAVYTSTNNENKSTYGIIDPRYPTNRRASPEFPTVPILYINVTTYRLYQQHIRSRKNERLWALPLISLTVRLSGVHPLIQMNFSIDHLRSPAWGLSLALIRLQNIQPDGFKVRGSFLISSCTFGLCRLYWWSWVTW